MKRQRNLRVPLILLSVLLLTACAIGVRYHGEWWFPLVQSWEEQEAVSLQAVALSEETRIWSLSELAAHPGVTISNNLLLVNESHPLPKDYVPVLVEYNSAKMHPLMKEPYIALRDAVQAETGVRIYVASDYRTPEEQAEILASSPAGTAAALGCSEHEAGLALDVYAPYAEGIAFLRSPAGRQVNRVCWEYGYVIRYPKDKASVTGISYEPWHLRYVGAPHAEIMTKNQLTLEEYITSLVPNTWYQTESGVRIARLSPEALVLPAELSGCEISPDNTGYCIVTLQEA